MGKVRERGMTNVSLPSAGYLSTPKQTSAEETGKSKERRGRSLPAAARASWRPARASLGAAGASAVAELSQPPCRPPRSPPARGADPLVPALPLAGADWPAGVTCKDRGRGCAATVCTSAGRLAAELFIKLP